MGSFSATTKVQKIKVHFCVASRRCSQPLQNLVFGVNGQRHEVSISLWRGKKTKKTYRLQLNDDQTIEHLISMRMNVILTKTRRRTNKYVYETQVL